MSAYNTDFVNITDQTGICCIQSRLSQGVPLLGGVKHGWAEENEPFSS